MLSRSCFFSVWRSAILLLVLSLSCAQFGPINSVHLMGKGSSKMVPVSTHECSSDRSSASYANLERTPLSLIRAKKIIEEAKVPAFVKPEYITQYQPIKNDVFVCSYPKSGTNWLNQIVHQIRTRGSVAREKEDASKDLRDLVPFLEAELLNFDELEHPRIFQSHFEFKHMDLFGDPAKFGGPKYIYIVRDPMDCSMSFYRYVKQFEGEVEEGTTADQFAQVFMSGNLYYGAWYKHFLSFWEAREQENVLFIAYESLQQDLTAGISEISQFLGVDLSDEELQTISYHASFPYMKQMGDRISGPDWTHRVTGINLVKNFTLVAKGKSGVAKSELSAEIIGAFDQYFQDNITPVLGVKSYDEWFAKLYGNTNKIPSLTG